MSQRKCSTKTKRQSRDHSRRQFRRAVFEQLEARALLNAEWQNPARPIDVNNDLRLTALDALLVINGINASGTNRSLTGHRPALAPYIDVNGDNHVTAIDALRIINAMNVPNRNPVLVSRLDGEADTARPVSSA